MNSNEILGKRLEKARKNKGYTQSDIAEKLSVKRESVSQWEHGERDIKASQLIELANILDVSADYLLGLSDMEIYDADIKSVSKFLGISETLALSLQVNFEEIVESEDASGILKAIEWIFYNGVICDIADSILLFREEMDKNILFSTNAIIEEKKKNMFIDVLTEKMIDLKGYAEFTTYKLVMEKLNKCADMMGSFFTEEEIKKLNDIEKISDLIELNGSFESEIANKTFKKYIIDYSNLLLRRTGDINE